jgi:two-component system sensor histidine kinase QseC
VAGNGAAGSGLGWSVIQRIAAVHGTAAQAAPSHALGGLAVEMRMAREAAPALRAQATPPLER